MFSFVWVLLIKFKFFQQCNFQKLKLYHAVTNYKSKDLSQMLYLYRMIKIFHRIYINVTRKWIPFFHFHWRMEMEALMENGIIADNTTWKGINTTRMWIFVICINEVNTTRNSIKASRLKKKRLLPHEIFFPKYRNHL